MFDIIRLGARIAVALAGLLVLLGSGTAVAQIQTLKDVNVHTANDIVSIDFSPDPAVTLQNPGESRSFRAIAFAPPAFEGASSRDLLAVDGTDLLAYTDGTNEAADSPRLLRDLGANPLRLRNITIVAADENGNIYVEGKPRGKPQQLWKLDGSGDPLAGNPVAVGTPGLSDAVFIEASDEFDVDGDGEADAGLLGASKSGIYFFPATDPAAFVEVIDKQALGLAGNTRIQSADWASAAGVLLITTSNRQIISVAAQVYTFYDLGSTPAADSCTSAKSQELNVRVARSSTVAGNGSVAVVSDAACALVHRFDFITAMDDATLTESIQTTSSPLGIAVGEGSIVDLGAAECNQPGGCPVNDNTSLQLLATGDTEALVLEFPELCDSRVPKDLSIEVCQEIDPTVILPGNELDLNALLPPALQASLLADGVQITVPNYIFGAGPNGKFGTLVIDTDAITSIVSGTTEVSDFVGFTLDCDPTLGSLPRGTPVGELIDNDLIAYSRTGGGRPTVRGYEVTPVSVGCGSAFWRTPGLSAILVGLQYDGDAPGGREADGGLPDLDSIPGPDAPAGTPPQCPLVRGTQTFTPYTDSAGYFLNLVACLFSDLETLAATVIPDSAFANPTDRALLLSRLDNAKDKLIKSLNACDPTDGSSCGSENFGSFLAQMLELETEVSLLSFNEIVYQQELLVRSEVIRYNTENRLIPSLP